MTRRLEQKIERLLEDFFRQRGWELYVGGGDHIAESDCVEVNVSECAKELACELSGIAA